MGHLPAALVSVPTRLVLVPEWVLLVVLHSVALVSPAVLRRLECPLPDSEVLHHPVWVLHLQVWADCRHPWVLEVPRHQGSWVPQVAAPSLLSHPVDSLLLALAVPHHLLPLLAVLMEVVLLLSPLLLAVSALHLVRILQALRVHQVKLAPMAQLEEYIPTDYG